MMSIYDPPNVEIGYVTDSTMSVYRNWNLGKGDCCHTGDHPEN